jgi:hypothetical protein
MMRPGKIRFKIQRLMGFFENSPSERKHIRAMNLIRKAGGSPMMFGTKNASM